MTDFNVLALASQTDYPTPEAMLKALLPPIVEAIPAATCAQVYRLANDGMVVWHSVASEFNPGQYYPIESGSPYEQAIQTGQPQIEPTYNLVIAPLIGLRQTAYALLAVEFESAPQIDAVMPLVHDLGLLLSNQVLQTSLERQLALMEQFNEAQTLPDIAGIVAHTMATSGQFVTINLFEYDRDGNISGARAIASANGDDTRTLDLPIEVEVDTLRLMRDLLAQSGDVLISDVNQESRFSQAALAWLKAQRAKSVYLLPLFINAQIYAFLSVIDTKNSLAFTEQEKMIYHNLARQAGTMIEKNNLIEQSRRRAARSSEEVRVMRLLNDLIATANVATDEQIVFDRAVEVLQSAVVTDHVSVVLYREGQLIIAYELPERGLIGQALEVGNDAVGALLTDTQEPLIIENVQTDDRLPAVNRALLTDKGIAAIVFIPMFAADGSLIGTVNLDYAEPHAIDLEMVNLARTISYQVTLAVQRVRVLSASQQQAKQLALVTEFGQALRAHLSISDILNAALTYGDGLLEARYMGITLHDTDSRNLRVVAERLNDRQTVNVAGRVLDLEAHSIAGEVWQSTELLHVTDISADWAWKHPHERELRSLLVMPLISAGAAIGLVEVGHADAHAFNDVDVAAFQQMANQLSIALANAEAYAQSQKLARNKTLANDIIARLQRQTEVSDILRLTAQELGKALQARRARIRLGKPPQRSGDKA